MKPSRLLVFHLVCVTVVFTFLANIAQAEDVVKPTKAQTWPSQSARFIQFSDSLLTVNAQDVPLKELLDEIARQSGLSVVGSGSLDEEMRLILRHHSFALD